MAETIWSRLKKLNRINVEQYKNYSCKLNGKILRYVDFIADFTHVQYVLRLIHRTRVFCLRSPCPLPLWPE